MFQTEIFISIYFFQIKRRIFNFLRCKIKYGRFKPRNLQKNLSRKKYAVFKIKRRILTLIFNKEKKIIYSSVDLYSK